MASIKVWGDVNGRFAAVAELGSRLRLADRRLAEGVAKYDSFA